MGFLENGLNYKSGCFMVFPKIGVPPNHPWINGVFHYFPFWGKKTLFLERPKSRVLSRWLPYMWVLVRSLQKKCATKELRGDVEIKSNKT